MSLLLLEKLFDFASWGINEWLAQLFGLLATLCYVISYIQKRTKVILVLQFAGSICFFFNMMFMHAIVGMLCNVIGIIRNIINLHRAKFKWAGHWCWYPIFIISFIGCGIFSYINGDGWLAILPVCAMILSTIALSFDAPFKIRLFIILSTLFWIVYDVFFSNVMGLANDIISIVFALIGIFTIDYVLWKKAKYSINE